VPWPSASSPALSGHILSWLHLLCRAFTVVSLRFYSLMLSMRRRDRFQKLFAHQRRSDGEAITRSRMPFYLPSSIFARRRTLSFLVPRCTRSNRRIETSMQSRHGVSSTVPHSTSPQPKTRSQQSQKCACFSTRIVFIILVSSFELSRRCSARSCSRAPGLERVRQCPFSRGVNLSPAES
jgi:hypothetical protein